MREMLGFFPADPLKDIRKFASEYIERTEAYDRTVCHGPVVHCGILPANGEELALIVANARLVFADIKPKVEAIGFNARQLMDAIQDERRKKH